MKNKVTISIQEFKSRIAEAKGAITKEINDRYAELTQMIAEAKQVIPDYQSPLDVPTSARGGWGSKFQLRSDILKVLSENKNGGLTIKELRNHFTKVKSEDLYYICYNTRSKVHDGFKIEKLAHPEKGNIFIKQAV
jgi:hypothetical protein